MIRFKEIQVFLGSCKEENKHIEKDVGWEEGQIFEKTGITTRVISAHDEGTELLASKSSKKLKSSLNGINLIISVTNTPSKNFPGISNFIHSLLDLDNRCHCISLNAGCSGYVDALRIAYSEIKRNHSSRVLIVTSDTYSKYISRDNRSIRPLFGDGSSCTLIDYDEGGFTLEKESYISKKDSQDVLCMSNNEIFMDGPKVLSFGISNVIPQLKEIISSIDLQESILIPHQAGKIMIDRVKNSIDKKIEVLENYRHTGNLVSTSIPNAIYQSKINLNNYKTLIFVGFGVGLASSIIVLTKQ